MSAKQVAIDLRENHHRQLSETLVQRIGEKVSEICIEHEQDWEYAIPELPDPVTHISIGVDGTTTAIRGEGYRETMCGTISLYNKNGDRLHSIYAACAPEFGKESFSWVMDWEIEKMKKKYPGAIYIGLADGCKWNWQYFSNHVEVQILDFYHVTERLGKISGIMKLPKQSDSDWMDDACSDLKHKPRAARKLLQEMLLKAETCKAPELSETITYFTNNLDRMNYARYSKLNFPIGSGVTEAACKVVAKQRLSNSGMRWNEEGAQNMLAIRGLVCTEGRWNQFWNHYKNAA